jgi:hypothetical protein
MGSIHESFTGRRILRPSVGNRRNLNFLVSMVSTVVDGYSYQV